MKDISVVFDGSFEGLLTIVHKKYYEKLNPDRILCADLIQDSLFAEYIEVETDFEKAETVMNAIAKISLDARDTAYMAYCSTDENRYIDIFKYIVLGFSKGRDLDNYIKLDYVRNVQNYARFVGREAHLYKGFTRFKEIQNNVFLAKIEPVNNVLPFLAQHFADRLSMQAWILYDTNRKLAAIFDTKSFAIFETEALCDEFGDDALSPDSEYQELWRGFVSHIAVEGRINPKLQRQLLPKRYRRFMTEFQLGK